MPGDFGLKFFPSNAIRKACLRSAGDVGEVLVPIHAITNWLRVRDWLFRPTPAAGSKSCFKLGNVSPVYRDATQRKFFHGAKQVNAKPVRIKSAQRSCRKTSSASSGLTQVEPAYSSACDAAAGVSVFASWTSQLLFCRRVLQSKLKGPAQSAEARLPSVAVKLNIRAFSAPCVSKCIKSS